MIVYGDHARRHAPRPALRALADALAAEGATPDALVDAAALCQGLIDAEFQARGEIDARSPMSDALTAELTRLAGALLHGGAPDAAAWRGLADTVPPEPVSARLAEGFAFYALDPRAFARSARDAGLGPGTTVIGLRSIGTALGAVVAAACGAPPPITVRPTGPPFRRRLSLRAELQGELAAARGAVAVVDEGPGLSGSSFLAVAETLAAAGVARERLVLLPSHPDGPGAEAPDDARRLFGEARVHAPPSPGLAEVAASVADLIGGALGAPEELGGGAWRERLYADLAEWPASALHGERRKLRVRTDRGVFLLKWAGLGEDGRAKLARGGALADAGLSPPVLGLREGWLVQRWIEGRPLGPPDPPPLAELTALLALRTRAFPAGADDGASSAALAEMARVNVGEALGPQPAAAAEACVARGLAGAAPARVMVDARLHRHEWLRTDDGRVLKTDALDHARGHDLIGAQEIGWDVAGAEVEWDLPAGDVRRLAEATGASAERLPALCTAYLAFQLGAAQMAAEALAYAPDEQRRLAAARDRYAARLMRELA